MSVRAPSNCSCNSIFLLVKIFLKLHIADCCCCGVNLVSFVRPLQAEICSRHEFWWWQVVASSGGGGGVVQYRTTEAVQRLSLQPLQLALACCSLSQPLAGCCYPL